MMTKRQYENIFKSKNSIIKEIPLWNIITEHLIQIY
jgi:hypothetical protein